MEKVWRLIYSGPCGASFNMALDEAVATLVRRKDLPPVLRLYGWDKISLSLGCFQKVDDIDIGYCGTEDIPVVRRPTGGRAILHGDELTYSFSTRTDKGFFSKGLLDSYRRISSAFHAAFVKIGVHAESKSWRERGRVLAGSPLCFQSSSYGEILVAGKKVVGSAQKRWDSGLLQQGSIPYSYDEARIRKIFGGERYASLLDCTVGLKDIYPELEEGKFRDAIAEAFEKTFGISFVPAAPSQEELSLAAGLEREKYLPARSNFRD